MTVDVRLDSHGIAEVLRTQARSIVSSTAAQVGAATRENLPADVDVVVDDYTTDRAASSVTIRDVRALAWQARDGVLTRAAAAAGLEVTAR